MRAGSSCATLALAVLAETPVLFPRRLTKLDAWKTALLLTIKRSIAEEPALT